MGEGALDRFVEFGSFVPEKTLELVAVKPLIGHDIDAGSLAPPSDRVPVPAQLGTLVSQEVDPTESRIAASVARSARAVAMRSVISLETITLATIFGVTIPTGPDFA